MPLYSGPGARMHALGKSLPVLRISTANSPASGSMRHPNQTHNPTKSATRAPATTPSPPSGTFCALCCFAIASSFSAPYSLRSMVNLPAEFPPPSPDAVTRRV